MSDQHTTAQYQLRLSEQLRDKIKESAKVHNRSMNADIVARLEQSFEVLNTLNDGEKADYEELKRELRQDVKSMSKEISALVKQVTEYQNREHR